MYYVALVVREIDNGEGKMARYCECISDKDEAVVDAKLLALSQERVTNKHAPAYFYRRADGKTYLEALRACIKAIEEACEEEGIDPGKIHGLGDLLPR